MGQTKQEADANMDANMEQVMKMANKMKDAGLMPEPVGRYQASSVYANYKTLGISGGGTDLVITTIIDTRTGEIVKKVKLKSKDYDEKD